jgi:mannitol-1-/sugar-/sorbitol-6-phosphatase
MLDPLDVAAVLFDADGTLVDSDAAVERAWTAWALEWGIDPSAALEIAHGSPAEHTVATLVPDLDAAELVVSAARQLALQYDDLGDVGPMPGVELLMAVLRRRGLPWAVVTSGDRRLATARLAAAAIATDVLVTVEDVVAGKPDPEGYLLAARTLGVPPSRCLVVEDSEPGLAAGRAAGAMTAALKGLDGDLSVAGLAELADWLDV